MDASVELETSATLAAANPWDQWIDLPGPGRPWQWIDLPGPVKTVTPSQPAKWGVHILQFRLQMGFSIPYFVCFAFVFAAFHTGYEMQTAFHTGFFSKPYRIFFQNPVECARLISTVLW